MYNLEIRKNKKSFHLLGHEGSAGEGGGGVGGGGGGWQEGLKRSSQMINKRLSNLRFAYGGAVRNL